MWGVGGCNRSLTQLLAPPAFLMERCLHYEALRNNAPLRRMLSKSARRVLLCHSEPSLCLNAQLDSTESGSRFLLSWTCSRSGLALTALPGNGFICVLAQ